MGKGRIVFVILSQIKVKIDERSHQIGLPGSHRQTEEVVGIGDAVEYLLERGLVVYLVGMLFDIVLQFRSQLLAFLVM